MHPREVPRPAHLKSPEDLGKPLVPVQKVSGECWGSVLLTSTQGMLLLVPADYFGEQEA